MPLDFKKRLWLSLFLVGLIIFFISIVLIWLAFDISKRAATIQETKKELDFKFKTVETASSFNQDIQQANQEVSFLKSLLPIADDLINFPKSVSDLAKRYKVDVGFSFGKEIASENNQPGNISFTMTANGTFNNWLDFIKNLEKSYNLISFDSFNLVADGNRYRSVINGKIFTQ